MAADPVAGQGWIRRHLGMAVVVVAALVVLVVIVGPTAKSPAPLDPASTTSNGTKALVLLLRAVGAEVHTGQVVPAAPRGVALVLGDQLNPSDRAALQRWVDGGGTLVVADPTSSLSGVALDESTQDAIFDGSGSSSLSPDCSLPALGSVGVVDTSGGVLLRPVAGQVGCFPQGHGYFLVAHPEQAGMVVAIAGPQLWTNAQLAKADNSVLAVRLLAPAVGSDVTVVAPSTVGAGHQGLLGLISPRVLEAFWGIVGALCLIVVWRARRLGRPVADTLPVELPGSGLVVATANLLQEAGQRGYAAGILRNDLRHSIAGRLGIDPVLPIATMADLASPRLGLSADELVALLDGPAPVTDGELVALAQRIGRTRRELSNAR